MIEATNLKTIHKPPGMYSHTVLVPAGAAWLVISGQVGMNAKRVIAAGARKQA